MIDNSDLILKKFAVVRLWPEIKNAESECIERIIFAAKKLSIDVFEIYNDGRYVKGKKRYIKQNEVDFVLHLHFDTPKAYDAYSIVALWNPVGFYYQWGFDRTTRNLLSHDDFISCSSLADLHLEKIIRLESSNRQSPSKLMPPHENHLRSNEENGQATLPLKLFHSLYSTVHKPSTGKHRVFYIGINWEALDGAKKHRHQDLLKKLDDKDVLSIYGPRKFLGQNVWKGYESYVDEIPFDGMSVVNKISENGIALVLSSAHHISSEIMSSRLFEAIAAGALIICDENPFAFKHFGNSLLYINSTDSSAYNAKKILGYVSWAKKNNLKAVEMIKKTQLIFNKKFSHKVNLTNLYENLLTKKSNLAKDISSPFAVAAYFLLVKYSKKNLEKIISNIECQDYKNFTPYLVLSLLISDRNLARIRKAISSLSFKVKIILVQTEYFDYSYNKKLVTHYGRTIHNIVMLDHTFDAFIMIDDVTIFSNHISALVKPFLRGKIDVSTSSSVFVGTSSQGKVPNHNINVHDVFSKLSDQNSIFNPSCHSYLVKKDVLIKFNEVFKVMPNIPYNFLFNEQLEFNHGRSITSVYHIETIDKFKLSHAQRFEENAFIAHNNVSPNDLRLPTIPPHLFMNPNSNRLLSILWVIFLKSLNPLWVLKQIMAIKKHGLNARIQILQFIIRHRQL